MPDNNWAAVIDGVIAVEEAGEHDFFVSSDDGSHLWIDGQMLVDNGGMHGAEEEKTGAITLDEGYHSIKINLFDAAAAAALIVRWKG